MERRVQSQRRERLDKGQEPNFNVENRVYARFWYGSRRWRKRRIVALGGPLSYDVQVDDEMHRRHAFQLFHDRAQRVLEGEGENNFVEYAEPEPLQAELPKSVPALPVQEFVAPPLPEPKSQAPPTKRVEISPQTTPTCSESYAAEYRAVAANEGHRDSSAAGTCAVNTRAPTTQAFRRRVCWIGIVAQELILFSLTVEFTFSKGRDLW